MTPYLLAADDALHLAGNSVLPADVLQTGSTQNARLATHARSFASTVDHAFSIRTGRVSQASSAVSYMDACYTYVYIVCFTGRPGF